MNIVERLRACQGVLTHDPECNCTEAADEIERLKTERDDWYMRALKAEAEIERLRAALREIAEGEKYAFEAQKIAHRALESKP